MDKATLATMILDTAHRPDLTALTDDFIRQAEGLIAREVRGVDQIVTLSLTTSDRTAVDSPVYTLPTNFLMARSLWIESLELKAVSLAQLRRISESASAQWYAVRGGTIEFRGNPSDADVIEMDYYSRVPALSTGTDTTDLLDEHEEIYLSAALFFLYRYTQDAELAQAFFQSYVVTRDALNAAATETIGGQNVAPAYNFTSESAY